MANQDPFGFNNLEDILRAMNRDAQQQQASQPAKGSTKDKTLLDEFGLDMTEQARQGLLDPVIGRDSEIARVIEILNRRTKNNPVLIGEPGVGKTAVVEGLAQAIVTEKVPEKLQNKAVIRLDVVALVQGTAMRGQFEERMQRLMKEVTDRDDVILFIDEIHEIMGAGNAEGGMDAGNILKPALARGEFQLVGATTLNEYRKIEKDGAIARRFQPVQVNEPTLEEARIILQGIRSKYEDYHRVHYTDDALQAAVDLSDRYLPERFLPDKAIDLLDEAGSRKNLTIPYVDPATIQKKINSAESMKQQAVDKQDYEKAAYWRDQVVQLTRQKTAAESQQTEHNANEVTVTDHDIMQIIEERTDIPVGELKDNEATQLRELDTHLKAAVIGQDTAVNKVARAVQRSRIGLTKSGRPIGSFLFVGPTGVGKTETAKQLAKEMFGREDALIRFDMSEYMEKHTVSKLIGAPAGYVGYEEAGQLTEQVRRRPYALILLDEIEKAHPDVMNLFLQILDDGRLTDAQGHVVSFKDTIIIMTSNAGAGESNATVGFSQQETSTTALIQKLTQYFRPEFLNRFDDIIEFQPLDQSHLLEIVNLLLAKMNHMLADNHLHVTVSDAAKSRLVALGYDPKMGARPLRRVLQEQIEDQVADVYLDNPEVTHLTADVNDADQIIVTAETSAVAVETPSS